MKQRIALIVAVGLSLGSVSSVEAQRRGNRRERAGNNVQRVENRAAVADDRTDRAQINSIAAAWTSAVDRHDRAAERAADTRLTAWLNRERRENAGDVARADRERRGSNAELGRSRREARRSGTRDDRRDRRDDRRDARDDRRDEAHAVVDANQTRNIANQLAAMQPAFNAGTATPAQYTQKRQLLARLQRMAGREVRQDRREIREDGRERREDGRERREDRRTRRRHR